MFRRSGTGSFPNAASSETDEIFDHQVCGQVVAKHLVPKRKSLMSPKSRRGTKSSVSPRRQKKFRKKMYYEELVLDLSPVESEEDSFSIDDLTILDYDDPDLEAPVFWAASDKLEQHLDKKLKKRLKRKERAESKKVLVLPSSAASKESLPAVTELLDEEQGYPTTDSPSSDESEPVRSKSSRTKHARKPKKAWRDSEIDDNERVVLALRDLVLQQQKTVFKMADKNKEYRQRLASCQSRILMLKNDHLDQKDIILSLELDKESLEAETLWLREELETIRNELTNCQKRERKYEDKIMELRREQIFAREKHEAILAEARHARADLYAIAGDDDSSAEANFQSTSAVETSEKLELQNEIAGLRLLISNLRKESKRKSVDEQMPEWLDLSSAIQDSKGGAKNTPGARQSLAIVDDVFHAEDERISQDHEDGCIPEWLDLVSPNENGGAVGLSYASEGLVEDEKSTISRDENKKGTKAPLEVVRHATSSAPLERNEHIPESRDPISPIPDDIEEQRFLSEENTMKADDKRVTLSSFFSIDGDKTRAEIESEITLHVYSEILSFLSENSTRVCSEREIREEVEATQGTDLRHGNMPLDVFFEREKQSSQKVAGF